MNDHANRDEIPSLGDVFQYALQRVTGESEMTFGEEVAEILATPEMEAIKEHIRHVAMTCGNSTVESFIQGSDLPQTVKDWVVS